MKKIVSLILILCLFITFLTGCSSTFKNDEGEETGSEDSKVSQVLRYVYSYAPTSFDTSTCYDDQGGQLLYNTSEGLLRFYDNKVNQGLAKEWEVSDDGLVYTFYLRDAVWEDGVEITAHDFEYSFKRFFSPEMAAAANASTYYMIKNSAAYNTGKLKDWNQVGVKALDDKTLQITLEYKVPYFLTLLASSSNLYPLRQDFVEECGEKYATDAEHYLSCGPFKLESFNPDTEIVYTKNEKYWNADAIKLERIEVVISTDANTNVAMFDNGEIDWYPEFKPSKFPDYEVPDSYLNGTLQFIQMNSKGTSEEAAKVINNANFRKALSYAFDKESFIKSYEGEKTVASVVAHRIAAPGIYIGLDGKGSFDEDFEYNDGVTYNPELAKEYLNKALEELGYNSVEDLPKMKFILFEVPAHRTYGEALLDAWERNLGITNIEATQLPISTAIEKLFAGDYDLYFQSMSLDVDLSIFLEYWTSNSDMNTSKWHDEKYDALYESSLKAETENERLAILAECEKYLMENGPIMPLYFQGVFEGLMVDGLENIDFSAGTTNYIYAYFTK